MIGICVEGIIASIHSVKVNVTVEQDVEPQSIGEVREIRSDDEVIFSTSSVNDVIGFECKGAHDVWIKDIGWDRDVSPGNNNLLIEPLALMLIVGVSR